MSAYEREKQACLEQEAMSESEYMGAALRQHADAIGADCPDFQWVLTPWDTWEINPHYSGPDQRHPEEYCCEDDE